MHFENVIVIQTSKYSGNFLFKQNELQGCKITYIRNNTFKVSTKISNWLLLKPVKLYLIN